MTEDIIPTYPVSNCERCSIAGEVIGQGSASGRLIYKCPECHAQWKGKNLAAMALGSLGGKARAEALTQEQRTAQAKAAGAVGGAVRAQRLTSSQRKDQASKAGKLGGVARARALTPKRRKEISVAARKVAFDYSLQSKAIDDLVLSSDERYVFNSDLRRVRIKKSRSIGTHTKEQWWALLKFCGLKCLKCGSEQRKITKDHIVPVYQGGSDLIDNIQPICSTCNQKKSAENIDYRPSGWESVVKT